ncbi:InlB B-repeat-containing protein, partial [Enterococcus durans]
MWYKKWTNKLTLLLSSIVLCVNLLPISAFAQEQETNTDLTSEIVAVNPEEPDTPPGDKYVKVSLDANGGELTGPSAYWVKKGLSFEVPDDTKVDKEGSVYAGWNSKKDGSGDSLPSEVNQAVTYYAQFTVETLDQEEPANAAQTSKEDRAAITEEATETEKSEQDKEKADSEREVQPEEKEKTAKAEERLSLPNARIPTLKRDGSEGYMGAYDTELKPLENWFVPYGNNGAVVTNNTLYIGQPYKNAHAGTIIAKFHFDLREDFQIKGTTAVSPGSDGTVFGLTADNDFTLINGFEEDPGRLSVYGSGAPKNSLIYEIDTWGNGNQYGVLDTDYARGFDGKHIDIISIDGDEHLSKVANVTSDKFRIDRELGEERPISITYNAKENTLHYTFATFQKTVDNARSYFGGAGQVKFFMAATLNNNSHLGAGTYTSRLNPELFTLYSPEIPPSENHVKVRLNSNGGEIKKDDHRDEVWYWVEKGTRFTVPSDITAEKDGIPVSGWTEKKDGSGNALPQVINGEVTYYAYYAGDVEPQKPDDPKPPVPDNYVKVEFDKGEHGTIAAGETTIYWVNPEKEVTVPAPKVTADKGYTFDKWDKNLTAQFTEATTITAQYEADSAACVKIDPAGNYQMHSDEHAIFWLENADDKTLNVPYTLFNDAECKNRATSDADVKWSVEMAGGFDNNAFSGAKTTLLPEDKRSPKWEASKSTDGSEGNTVNLHSAKSGIYKLTVSSGENSDYCYVVVPGDLNRDAEIQANDV